MPLLTEIGEDIIRTPSSGIITDESKYDYDYVYSLVHEYRAKAIYDTWQRVKRINSNWTQQYVCTYNQDIQDMGACFVRFPAPAAISLDDKQDGFLYVGSTDGNCAYRKVRTRAELANANVHRYVKNVPNKFIYSDGYIEIYGNTLIRELRIDGVFSDPTQVPTYNINFDQYPISDEILILLKNMLFREQTQIILAKPLDTKSDSQESIESIGK